MFNYLIVYSYRHGKTIGNRKYQLDHEFRSHDLPKLYETLDEITGQGRKCVILNIIYLGKS